MEREEFQLYYQSIVDAATGEMVSCEALVRWVLPNRDVIAPGMFISALEKNREFSALDLYMIRCVLQNFRQAMQSGTRVVPCAVNLSRLDIINEVVMRQILELVKQMPACSRFLRFEVTESVAA